MRIKIIIGSYHKEKTVHEDLEEKVNKFIESLEKNRKKAISVQYKETWMWMGNWEDSSLTVSALITYE